MSFLDRLFGRGDPSPGEPHPRPRRKRRSRRRAAVPAADFSTPLVVEYVNFRGERRTFTTDPASARLQGVHVSLRVAPSGRRIALKREKIVNRDAVEGTLQRAGRAGHDVPTPHEAYVMAFHERRGTTSALYTRLRMQYPR